MKNKNKFLEKQMRVFLYKLDNNIFIDYNDETIRQCVYICNQLGYVSGYRNCIRSDNNRISFDCQNPTLEKSGYEFLYPSKDWISIFTLIASVLTAIGVLFQLILLVAR